MRYDFFIGLNRGSSYASGPASVSQPEAIALVARTLHAVGIPAATIVPSFGVWEGTLEPGLVVTIIAADGAIGPGSEAIAELALRLAAELRQDCIGVELGGRLALVVHDARLIETARAIEALDVRLEAR